MNFDMHKDREKTRRLTKNQNLVLGALSKAKGPLSAYALLDQLRDDGLRAPLQIYRALEKLVEIGMVHRIESINSFVACRHEACGAHDPVAFMICDTCGDVAETSNGGMMKSLNALSRNNNFTLQKTAIELHGICHNCLKAH